MKIDWIRGRGHDSNIFLVRANKSLLIDSGTGSNFDRINKKLEEIGFGLENLDILLNTHCHYDHTGGNIDIIEASDCDLWASVPAAEALQSGGNELTLASMFGANLEPMNVSRVLEEGDKIDLGGINLNVLSTPGHTKGSISLYEPEKRVLFSGDAVFKEGVGRTDLPSSDREDMRNTLKRLDSLEVEKLYSGHGPIAEENADRCIKMAMRILGI